MNLRNFSFLLSDALLNQLSLPQICLLLFSQSIKSHVATIMHLPIDAKKKRRSRIAENIKDSDTQPPARGPLLAYIVILTGRPIIPENYQSIKKRYLFWIIFICSFNPFHFIFSLCILRSSKIIFRWENCVYSFTATESLKRNFNSPCTHSTTLLL